jgi:hypothetical protein
MLAFTMQFSNNQPSPTTNTLTGALDEAGSITEENNRSLRTQQRARPGNPPSRSTPKQY